MLNKIKVALVLTGSLLCGVAAAQPAPGSGAGAKPDFRAQHAAKKAEMLQRFDGNRDGKLDDTERTAMHDALTVERFKALDTDANGQLSLAEFKAGKGRFGKHGMRHARGKFGGRGHRGMGNDVE
jgi:hypothetical protein